MFIPVPHLLVKNVRNVKKVQETPLLTVLPGMVCPALFGTVRHIEVHIGMPGLHIGKTGLHIRE